MAQTQLSYKNKTYQISYEILGDLTLPQILILHGWGANKELMKQSFFLKNSTFYPLEGDHFFFLKYSAFIAQKIKEI